MTYRIAFPLVAFLVTGGCGGRDATSPMTRDATPAPVTISSDRHADDDNDGENSRRSGALHVTKECTEYTRLAGGFCTITSSSLKEIVAGTKVIYLKASGATLLDTDVILQPPGRGKDVAFGHVVLNLATRSGQATFSGGTGKFKKFQAAVNISFVSPFHWAWDGTYSFGKKGERD
jgi:hypothetical protein